MIVVFIKKWGINGNEFIEREKEKMKNYELGSIKMKNIKKLELFKKFSGRCICETSNK